MFQNLIVGGKTPHGEDATNKLSFMCLDATAHTRLPQPSISVRWNNDSPEDLLVKGSKVTKIGLGMPSWYNDELIIPSMLNRGRSIEDANDYCIIGCVEPDVWGREYGWHDAMFFNLNFCLELALNDGVCLNCSEQCMVYDKCVGAGEQLGPKTGKLSDFKTFEEVQESYTKQVEYFVHLAQEFNNAEDAGHMIHKSLPFLSTVMEPCIERGLDVTAGGAKYNYTGPQGIGMSNAGDGLTAVKKLCYDDKEVTPGTLLEALNANWEGYEDLRAKVNGRDMPHYGNDDDYADDLTAWASEVYCKAMEKAPNPRGGIFQPGLYPVSGNVPAGSLQWATPDGRKAGEAIADGVSPVHGHDFKGPTALVRSASKLDHLIASNGTLLNMKFTPNSLAGTVGDKNFLAMTKVYFDRKGLHAQHNVVSRDMLLDAQKNPDNYSGLVIRVAGYSVFFTGLDKAVQDDIIDRTQLEF
jgi:formate C-acetyltransferase